MICTWFNLKKISFQVGHFFSMTFFSFKRNFFETSEWQIILSNCGTKKKESKLICCQKRIHHWMSNYKRHSNTCGVKNILFVYFFQPKVTFRIKVACLQCSMNLNVIIERPTDRKKASKQCSGDVIRENSIRIHI